MVALTIDLHSRFDTRSSARADLSSPFDHPQLSVFEMRRISHKKAQFTRGDLLCDFCAFLWPLFCILTAPFAFPQTRFARLHPQSPVPSALCSLSCSGSRA